MSSSGFSVESLQKLIREKKKKEFHQLYDTFVISDANFDLGSIPLDVHSHYLKLNAPNSSSPNLDYLCRLANYYVDKSPISEGSVTEYFDFLHSLSTMLRDGNLPIAISLQESLLVSKFAFVLKNDNNLADISLQNKSSLLKYRIKLDQIQWEDFLFLFSEYIMLYESKVAQNPIAETILEFESLALFLNFALQDISAHGSVDLGVPAPAIQGIVELQTYILECIVRYSSKPIDVLLRHYGLDIIRSYSISLLLQLEQTRDVQQATSWLMLSNILSIEKLILSEGLAVGDALLSPLFLISSSPTFENVLAHSRELSIAFHPHLESLLNRPYQEKFKFYQNVEKKHIFSLFTKLLFRVVDILKLLEKDSMVPRLPSILINSVTSSISSQTIDKINDGYTILEASHQDFSMTDTLEGSGNTSRPFSQDLQDLLGMRLAEWVALAVRAHYRHMNIHIPLVNVEFSSSVTLVHSLVGNDSYDFSDEENSSACSKPADVSLCQKSEDSGKKRHLWRKELFIPPHRGGQMHLPRGPDLISTILGESLPLCWAHLPRSVSSIVSTALTSLSSPRPGTVDSNISTTPIEDAARQLYILHGRLGSALLQASLGALARPLGLRYSPAELQLLPAELLQLLSRKSLSAADFSRKRFEFVERIALSALKPLLDYSLSEESHHHHGSNRVKDHSKKLSESNPFITGSTFVGAAAIGLCVTVMRCADSLKKRETWAHHAVSFLTKALDLYDPNSFLGGDAESLNISSSGGSGSRSRKDAMTYLPLYQAGVDVFSVCLQHSSSTVLASENVVLRSKWLRSHPVLPPRTLLQLLGLPLGPESSGCLDRLLMLEALLVDPRNRRFLPEVLPYSFPTFSSFSRASMGLMLAQTLDTVLDEAFLLTSGDPFVPSPFFVINGNLSDLSSLSKGDVGSKTAPSDGNDGTDRLSTARRVVARHTPEDPLYLLQRIVERLPAHMVSTALREPLAKPIEAGQDGDIDDIVKGVEDLSLSNSTDSSSLSYSSFSKPSNEFSIVSVRKHLRPGVLTPSPALNGLLHLIHLRTLATVYRARGELRGSLACLLAANLQFKHLMGVVDSSPSSGQRSGESALDPLEFPLHAQSPADVRVLAHLFPLAPHPEPHVREAAAAAGATALRLTLCPSFSGALADHRTAAELSYRAVYLAKLLAPVFYNGLSYEPAHANDVQGLLAGFSPSSSFDAPFDGSSRREAAVSEGGPSSAQLVVRWVRVAKELDPSNEQLPLVLARLNLQEEHKFAPVALNGRPFSPRLCRLNPNAVDPVHPAAVVDTLTFRQKALRTSAQLLAALQLARNALLIAPKSALAALVFLDVVNVGGAMLENVEFRRIMESCGFPLVQDSSANAMNVAGAASLPHPIHAGWSLEDENGGLAAMRALSRLVQAEEGPKVSNGMLHLPAVNSILAGLDSFEGPPLHDSWTPPHSAPAPTKESVPSSQRPGLPAAVVVRPTSVSVNHAASARAQHLHVLGLKARVLALLLLRGDSLNAQALREESVAASAARLVHMVARTVISPSVSDSTKVMADQSSVTSEPSAASEDSASAKTDVEMDHLDYDTILSPSRLRRVFRTLPAQATAPSGGKAGAASALMGQIDSELVGLTTGLFAPGDADSQHQQLSSKAMGDVADLLGKTESAFHARAALLGEWCGESLKAVELVFSKVMVAILQAGEAASERAASSDSPLYSAANFTRAWETLALFRRSSLVDAVAVLALQKDPEEAAAARRAVNPVSASILLSLLGLFSRAKERTAGFAHTATLMAALSSLLSVVGLTNRVSASQEDTVPTAILRLPVEDVYRLDVSRAHVLPLALARVGEDPSPTRRLEPAKTLALMEKLCLVSRGVWRLGEPQVLVHDDMNPSSLLFASVHDSTRARAPFLQGPLMVSAIALLQPRAALRLMCALERERLEAMQGRHASPQLTRPGGPMEHAAVPIAAFPSRLLTPLFPHKEDYSELGLSPALALERTSTAVALLHKNLAASAGDGSRALASSQLDLSIDMLENIARIGWGDLISSSLNLLSGAPSSSEAAFYKPGAATLYNLLGRSYLMSADLHPLRFIPNAPLEQSENKSALAEVAEQLEVLTSIVRAVHEVHACLSVVEALTAYPLVPSLVDRKNDRETYLVKAYLSSEDALQFPKNEESQKRTFAVMETELMFACERLFNLSRMPSGGAEATGPSHSHNHQGHRGVQGARNVLKSVSASTLLARAATALRVLLGPQLRALGVPEDNDCSRACNAFANTFLASMELSIKGLLTPPLTAPLSVSVLPRDAEGSSPLLASVSALCDLASVLVKANRVISARLHHFGGPDAPAAAPNKSHLLLALGGHLFAAAAEAEPSMVRARYGALAAQRFPQLHALRLMQKKDRSDDLPMRATLTMVASLLERAALADWIAVQDASVSPQSVWAYFEAGAERDLFLQHMSLQASSSSSQIEKNTESDWLNEFNRISALVHRNYLLHAEDALPSLRIPLSSLGNSFRSAATFALSTVGSERRSHIPLLLKARLGFYGLMVAEAGLAEPYPAFSKPQDRLTTFLKRAMLRLASQEKLEEVYSQLTAAGLSALGTHFGTSLAQSMLGLRMHVFSRALLTSRFLYIHANLTGALSQSDPLSALKRPLDVLLDRLIDKLEPPAPGSPSTADLPEMAPPPAELPNDADEAVVVEADDNMEEELAVDESDSSEAETPQVEPVDTGSTEFKIRKSLMAILHELVIPPANNPIPLEELSKNARFLERLARGSQSHTQKVAARLVHALSALVVALAHSSVLEFRQILGNAKAGGVGADNGFAGGAFAFLAPIPQSQFAEGVLTDLMNSNVRLSIENLSGLSTPLLLTEAQIALLVCPPTALANVVAQRSLGNEIASEIYEICAEKWRIAFECVENCLGDGGSTNGLDEVLQYCLVYAQVWISFFRNESISSSIILNDIIEKGNQLWRVHCASFITTALPYESAISAVKLKMASDSEIMRSNTFSADDMVIGPSPRQTLLSSLVKFVEESSSSTDLSSLILFAAKESISNCAYLYLSSILCSDPALKRVFD